MPYITQGKIILQRAWTLKTEQCKPIDWDRTLPQEISYAYEKGLTNLASTEEKIEATNLPCQ